MSTPDSSPPATGLTTGKLNATIGVVAFVIIFGCVVTFIILDLCLRYFTRNSILSRGIANTGAAQVITNLLNKGLDKAVIDSLPTFQGAPPTGAGVVECAVCLSEVEDKEQGRLLPKCQHAFHAECIDMWFQSHVTCPICRSTVTAASGDADPRAAIAVTIEEEGSSTASATAEVQDRGHLTIDIASTSKGGSSSESQEFRSPVAATLERLKSLRRLVSGGRREPTSAAGAEV